jgi:hypothetical protein
MIEILVGLLIATVAVLGWIAGNLFVCVFLTLPVAALGFIAATNAGNGIWLMGCIAAILIIWAPRQLRRYY